MLESEYEEICDINPGLKGGATWDSVYQKTPSAPPTETTQGEREPVLPVANGVVEFREQEKNLPEGNLVEIDSNESENVTEMTSLINIERESENVSVTNTDDVLKVESNDISSDTSHQKVFENDKQSPVEILQPIKAEDPPKSGGDFQTSEKNTNSNTILCDPHLDLMPSSKSGNVLPERDNSVEKDKTGSTIHSDNQDEVYEELH